MKHLLFGLLLLPVAGCPRSFQPEVDAGPAVSATPDAGPPADAPASCAPGVVWLDRDPALFEGIAPGSEPAITGDAEGFLVITTELDSDAWVYWSNVARLPREGSPIRTYGARFTPAPAFGAAVPRLFASTDPSDRGHVATLVDGTLWWASGPSFDIADGSVAIDRLLGAVAFEDGAVLFETHEVDPATVDRFGASRVSRLRGGTTEVVAGLDPTFGFPYWAPALATHADGPWVGIVNDVDFPPTVQVQGPRGGGWDGSSCGVESYDLVAESADTVVLSEDCGAQVVVERRRVTTGERDRAIVSGRDDRSPVPASRLATDGAHFAVVYWGNEGWAHVTVLDHALAPVATDFVPGNAPETIPGPLGIAATRDGTFAVLMSAWLPSGGGMAWVRRFRVGQVCR